MNLRYSKPSAAILSENLKLIQNDAGLHAQQAAHVRSLLEGSPRTSCLLCNSNLAGEEFTHRGIPYRCCTVCNHIQTSVLPPAGYPVPGTFSTIYPDLSAEDFNKRKTQIYQPKLQWIIESLTAGGYNLDRLRRMQWIEMGCGAGYFLSALLDQGIRGPRGFDADATLVKQANTHLSMPAAQVFTDALPELLQRYSADVYVAFFLLEHIAEPHRFLTMLRACPPGTIFAFSVPVYGFSCIIEQIFTDNWARNLDSEVHTQIYTDESIVFAMRQAGFDIIAEWIFGQDGSDLYRYVTLNAKTPFTEKFLHRGCPGFLNALEAFQAELDKNRLSDQRHVLAVKR
jgi:2-polyprenyl-3-methyl-5-hydroxy-6-metoxy-1,4-benzoquinol methylase